MKYTLNEHQAKSKVSGKDLLESVGVIGKIKPETVIKLTESAKGKSNRKLIVQMEAIHVGRTANYTFYTEEGLKNGLTSWTHPYNKPVLTHHNSHNGEAIGRILRAEYAEATASGRKGLIFTCEITDPTAVEKVLDGRYSTVSIGATTDKVTCNICGTDRTQDWCEHWKGDDYDGQTCHYIIGTTEGREVSYVNVPADQDAGNISVSIDDTGADSEESSTLQIFQIAEGLMQNINMPDVNLYESANSEVKEMVDGLLNTKEGSPTNVKFKLDEHGNQILDEHGKPIPETVVTEAELQTQLTEAATKITGLEKKLSEAQETLSNVVIEKSKADALLTESQEEVNRLTTENSDLIEKSHKSLAEKVVDMKLTLRKTDVIAGTREEAVVEHIKRTEESLNDAAKDLLAEMQSTTAVRGTVPNPGAPGADNNPADPNEKDQTPNTTIDEAVGMFKGMFGPKQRKR